MGKKNKSTIAMVALLLAIHLYADFCLCFTEVHEPVFILLFGLAIPISQAGLLALWASFSRWKSYVRYPLALFAVAWTWYVMVRAIYGDSDSGRAANFAFCFFLQFIIIIAICGLARLFRRRIARRKNGDAQLPPLQYSIGFLLIWTSVFALLLGLGKTLCLATGWTLSVIHDKYFFFSGVVGVYSASYALCAMIAAAARKRLVPHILIALATIALLASTKNPILFFIFNENGHVSTAEWLFLAASQSFYLFATLLPLRWCGLLKDNRDVPPIEAEQNKTMA